MDFLHTHSKPIVAFLMVIIVNQIAFPSIANALTSGPAQPEMQGFTPVGTTDMVDLFTGDFSYNIPLLDVGGYPLNLSYQSGITPDAEASWVGLGWTLNPGVINRDMRGMPDDFKGDAVTQESNMKDDITVGVTLSPGIEIGGFFGLQASSGIYWNSYRGYGFTAGVSPSISVGEPTKGMLTAGLGLNFDTGSGLDVSPSIGFSVRSHLENCNTLGFGPSVSGGVNSRRGLKDLTISINASGLMNDNPVESQRLFGSAINFGSSTYFPTSPLPLRNASLSFHGTLGTEHTIFNPNGTLNGYYSRQHLATNTQQQNAFGSLYAYDATPTDLVDFNREQQGPYKDAVPNLPIGYATYDMFNASGQGSGGQFRATRNDIGNVRDPITYNLNEGTNLGFELGALPNLAHAGFDINISTGESWGEGWVKDNEFLEISNYTTTDNTLYEPVFLKNTGELTTSDKGFYDNLGNTKAAYVKLERSGSTVLAKKDALLLESTQRPAGQKSLSSITTPLKRANREKRNQVFSYLNAKEASVFGLEKNIYSYEQNKLPSFPGSACLNDSLFSTETTISRTGTHRKDHHISEMTTTTPDGSRYVYGIPAYNTLQKEVSFSVEGLTPTDGLVAYTATGGNPDNSTSNKKGNDNYYDAQTIPAYAHSYLLTGVLSPDYVDVTGDGITDDDLGNAVKLNYTKRDSDYKWRTPYGRAGTGNQTNQARLQKGYNTDPKDDKANYLYGTKEVWYLHSVESKTMVAQIYLSDRLDGLAVQGENGTRDATTANSLQKIDSIALFSKSDIAACTSGQKPVPIKVVHFEYNYSLCGNVPNNSGATETVNGVNINLGKGKLTLKKVWFSYGKNKRGKFNAYKFGYNAAANPDYSNTQVDRWGSYKINPAGYPPETEFSYALQDKALADAYALSWNLDTIHIPSGGKIVANYEADDYAYVQDKRAGQMVFIKGFGTGVDATLDSTKLYTASGPYAYVYFDIPSGIVSSTADISGFTTKYLTDVGKIFFNCRVKVTKPNSSTASEYINGFMEYDKTKPVKLFSTTLAAIPIKIIKTDKNTDIHPITKAAFQTLRLSLPQLAYPGYTNDSAPVAVIKGMVSIMSSIKELLRGFDDLSLSEGKGMKIYCDKKSWIRLANPTYQKFGGGCRVKEIRMSDNWGDMASDQNTAEYGQSYSYVVGTSTTSSGVASYEPLLGGEENLWRQPMPYKERVLLAPDNFYYTTAPVGEALFPSPVVGYSEVKVRSVNTTNARTNTGYSIHRFFTAKDFPVITDFTKKKAEKFPRPGALRKFFKFKVKDYATLSQGYVIEVNDMHGKMKGEEVYNENGNLISSTIYHYKVDSDYAKPFHLNNDATVIQPNGAISGTPQRIGVDMDVWQDLRQETTKTRGNGAAINTNGFFAVIFPVIAVTVIPIFQSEETRFRSIVLTKFIKRHGILDKVTKMVDGSTISTENIAWDSETGEVLLTKTQNEFDDPIYNFTHPAHWFYKEMGPAYKNIGAWFTGLTITSGVLSNSTIAGYFANGDEIGVWVEGTQTWYTDKIYAYKDPSGSSMKFYNKNGALFSSATAGTGDVSLKILRSGRRNQANTPIGTTATLYYPDSTINSRSFVNFSKTRRVIDTNAATFSENWSKECSFCFSQSTSGAVINPYRLGMKGAWRPGAQYAFLTRRDRNENTYPTALDSTYNIRKNGYYYTFKPYWKLIDTTSTASSNWEPETADARWIKGAVVNHYDSEGNAVEEKDALGIYSTALYGYKKSLVTAVAHNSRLRQSAFDGFEDYSYKVDCKDDTCFTNNPSQFFVPLLLKNPGEASEKSSFSITAGVTDEKSHTGKYSFKVNPNGAYPSINDYPAANDSTRLIASSSTWTLGSGGCLPKFAPLAGDYVLSGWVSVGSPCTGDNSGAQIRIFYNSSGSPTTTATVAGPIIDGWQRIFVKFTVPSTSITRMLIQLRNTSSTDAYFDDFRIHPWLGNMKSFVYDPVSQRLMALLDENNYATFYEYDDEGTLIRVKRETERGISTLQENRSVLKPN